MRKLEFVSLQVKDLELSQKFYTEKLGFEVSGLSNPAACIFSYNKGEASFAIRKPIGNSDGKEPGVGVSIWFAIDGGVEALQGRLEQKGVAIVDSINNTPFGKTLMVQDPDGYLITFLEQSKTTGND